MTEEMNAIKYLLEVEAEASLLVKDAQKKADSRISEARAQAESEFKKVYGDFAKRLESEELAQKDDIEKKQKSMFDEYVSQLESAPKDKESFNALLDKLLYV